MTLVHTQPALPLPLMILRRNWRVYTTDGALIGIFMISACLICAILQHPASPVGEWIQSGFVRRLLIGVAMGLTAICLIYCPWGKRSGALMNPAVTLAFFRLGRIGRWDALFYILSQFLGATAGVGLMSILAMPWVGDSQVNYAVTLPGPAGIAASWVAEFFISMGMMTVVMASNKSRRLMPYTGIIAGLLVAIYITFEAPLSGMSMNPARSFGSAVFAQVWRGFWIYLTAPVLGMLAGIELHRLAGSARRSQCGKFTHSRTIPCFIRCECLQHADLPE